MRLTHQLLTVSALSLLTSVAMASNYNFELNGGYSEFETKDKAYDDDSSYGQAKIYFNGVDVKNHLFAEAAFLERASNISVAYHRTSGVYDDAHIYPGDHDHIKFVDEASNVNLEFWAFNKFLYVSGGVTDYKSRIRGTYHVGQDHIDARENIGPESEWNAAVGISPIAGLVIATDFYEDDDFDDVWTVRSKYVAEWGAGGINVELGYMNYYKEDIINAALDFFITRTFSIGGFYSYYEDSLQDDPWGVRARQFITPYFSVQGGYDKYDDDDGWNVGVTLRF